ncbi:MAG: hypothetical protein M5R36_11855 [Deltaproteobacteria bacterium]|nr:hypothetical protein [Deltaproteobacteria bacterium]
MKFGIGAPVRRKEDPAFISGRGRYLADHAPDDTLWACMLRSPVAHARFAIADLETARTMPGVVLVLTAADVPEPRPAALRRHDAERRRHHLAGAALSRARRGHGPPCRRAGGDGRRRKPRRGARRRRGDRRRLG